MHRGEQCFLARPEWREADRAPTESAAYGSEETQLKHMLSNLLLDFPDMIRQSADLVRSLRAQCARQDHQPSLEDAIHRQLQMKQKVEQWFATVPLKAGPNVDAGDGQTTPPKQGYRNLFCGIVDCIVNSVLVKLGRMMLCLSIFLESTDHGVHDLFCDPGFLQTIEEHRATAQEAFVFVKTTSEIGTKPLDFGLKMIGTDDDVFEVPYPASMTTPESASS